MMHTIILRAGLELPKLAILIILIVALMVIYAGAAEWYRNKQANDEREEIMDGPFKVERTGRFKFIEERIGQFVLYVEYKRLDLDNDYSGLLKKYWVRANDEDAQVYQEMQHGKG